MRLRRYYKKGVDYKYTISDAYLDKLTERDGFEKARRLDNASYEIILDTDEEQISWFNDCLKRVMSNPRFYLDNLEFLPEFKVRKKVIYRNIYKSKS